MILRDLFLEAARRGLRLEAAGDKLAVFPKGACPADFAAVLKENKDELLDLVEQPTVPGLGCCATRRPAFKPKPTNREL